MPLKIMIWNAQHFDHQKGVSSVAYRDKKSFVDHYLADGTIDLLVLLESGKTGAPNHSLATELQNKYTLLAAAAQEDGVKKDTTLGIMVFVKNDQLANFTALAPLALSSTEQRNAAVIRHIASGYGLAFYHANASFRAMPNIVDTVDFIQRNLRPLGLTKLGFFGGDLNIDCKFAHDSLSHRPAVAQEPGNEYTRFFVPSKRTPGYTDNARVLLKLEPQGSGYTHASIKPVWVLSAKSKKAQSRHNTARKTGSVLKKEPLIYDLAKYVTQVRMLDFAYVDSRTDWEATCDASIDVPDGRTTIPEKPRRFSKGKEMRSDHYPVIFTYQGSFT